MAQLSAGSHAHLLPVIISCVQSRLFWARDVAIAVDLATEEESRVAG